jgi:uncharacterized surface protein with fasciclin (FAS1) repeats
MRRKLSAVLLLIVVPASIVALAPWTAKAEKPADIVDTAVKAGSFNTLATALKAAGLVEALKGEGPFTVFAPTDEAFAKLPDGALEGLLKDKDKLTAILTYHVVPGRVTAANVIKLESAKTLQGQLVRIDASSGVRINNAKVTQADVLASNGVIHVIDTVLIPESKPACCKAASGCYNK